MALVKSTWIKHNRDNYDLAVQLHIAIAIYSI